MIRRGFAADNASHPTPRRSTVPGRKFSITMSACAANSMTNAAPVGADRSIEMFRLPAF
jgi:hypothetical protein